MFTVITPTLNAQRLECINSVSSQKFAEHIIVDGGSNDSTIDIAKSKNVKIIETKDSSIYQAINIGIKSSKTNYISFLNCDDYYPDSNILKRVNQIFENFCSIDLVYGNCKFVDINDNFLYRHYPDRKLIFKNALKQLFTISHHLVFLKEICF